MKDGRFLTMGIESSCDETAVAITADGREVLANIISSQIAIHTQYGGVVPEIASREHLTNINPCIEQALAEAGVTMDEIDLIGVTNGPGLIGALVIGVAAAKALALAADKPLIGVNHMHGHVSGNYIASPTLEPPFTALVVSGGHTNIVAVAPQHRRSRIGSYMLHTTIEACREAGIDLFTLEVRSGNDPAIRLYEKFGFRRDATRRGYYQDNGEDAILMSLQLAEGPVPEERA